MNPTLLSMQIRLSNNSHIRRRRAMLGTSLFSLGCMALISLYQIGIIKHIPEPAIAGVDADKVDASGEAYGHLQMGDAFIGMVSYAVTAALAAIGGSRRARKIPVIPLTMGAKVAFDLLQAGRLTYSQFSRHRAACFWCLAAAAATCLTAALAIPEVATAAQSLRKRGNWSSTGRH